MQGGRKRLLRNMRSIQLSKNMSGRKRGSSGAPDVYVTWCKLHVAPWQRLVDEQRALFASPGLPLTHCAVCALAYATGTPCDACGTVLCARPACQDDLFATCMSCNKRVCHACDSGGGCRRCSKIALCAECALVCEECDEPVACSVEHATFCIACNMLLCRLCIETCNDCGDHVCRDHSEVCRSGRRHCAKCAAVHACQVCMSGLCRTCSSNCEVCAARVCTFCARTKCDRCGRGCDACDHTCAE